MKIGCPTEIKPQEFRVGLTPAAAAEAVLRGHDVLVQSGAGLDLIHPDYEGLAREIAERTTPEGLVECQEAIAQCRERLAQQVQPAVAFNGMLGRIRLACKVS